MIRLLAAIGLALMTTQAFAQIPVPKSYSDGEVIDADELNTNLKAIADAVPPRDCTTDQIIKWDDTNDVWVCADMPSGGGAASPELVSTEQGNDPDQVIALCPSGKKVTGGGCQLYGACEFIESAPLDDLSGYGCVAESPPADGDACQVLRAIAICQ